MPPQPGFIEPMAAKLVDALPEGPRWVYEVKLDGYRVLASKDRGDVRLISRNNKDLTSDFPQVAKAVGTISVDAALLDGEIVAVDHDGVPRFQLLQHRSKTAKSHIVYYAFDVLHLDGKDLRARPLRERKMMLAAFVQGTRVLLSDALDGAIVVSPGGVWLDRVWPRRRDVAGRSRDGWGDVPARR